MLLWLITVAAYWFAASFIGTLIFVWLLKTGRIGFEPVEDDELAQFSHRWEGKR